jgi:RimJ/RimL family protein N-acetyltransferase
VRPDTLLDTATRKLRSLRLLLADARCHVRRLGPRPAAEALWALVSARARAFVHSRQTEEVLVKVLGGEPRPGDPEPPDDLRLELIGPHHAEELRRLRLNEDSCDSRRSRYALDNLAAGYQGFLVRSGGEIVGHMWWIDRHIAPDHPELSAYRIELADGDTYGFGYRIADQTRGGGIASDALRAMEREVVRLGYRRMWGYVDVANTPARWTYMIDGWSVHHTLERVRVLGFTREEISYAEPAPGQG